MKLWNRLSVDMKFVLLAIPAVPIVLAIAILLGGCAQTDFKRGTETKTTMIVYWSSSVEDDCKSEGAIADPGRQRNGCSTRTGNSCKVIAEAPIDFRDDVRVTVLGHETLHCLGWRH